MTDTSTEPQGRIMSPWIRAIVASLAAQKKALFLWTPVVLACGIGAYFLLQFEPLPAVTFGAACFMLASWALAWPWRHGDGWRYGLWLVASGGLLFTAGFSLAQLRTLSLDTVMLEKSVGPVTVLGKISDIDVLEEGKGMRLILNELEIERVLPKKTPQIVRIKVRTTEGLQTGDRVSVLARLNTPSAPVAPRAFDFQRYAYFKQIGAFGFAYQDPVVLEQGQQSSFSETMETLRQVINKRIRNHVTSPEAGFVTALITGERTAISDDDWDAMRGAGMAHMLAISGMHVGLVAGVIFFAVRFIMATWPWLTLHHPIKKYAAIIAFGGALTYTLMTGAAIPSVRALIMTGIVLFAVVIDRIAISPRLVAIAALAVLVLWPDSLWGASFQMSFAAVAALVVFYDWLRPYWSGWYRGAGRIRRLALYFVGVSLTTIIATIATAPFSLYHFQHLALYSLPANFFAVPLLGFIVMPSAVLACVLMPFQLEGAALWVMQKGITGIVSIAHAFADRPEAVLHMTTWPLAGLLLIVAASLILMLWRGKGRLLALIPLVTAIFAISVYQQPDIYVTSSGKLMAVRDESGLLHVSSRVRDRFSSEEWRRHNGEDTDKKPEKWPLEGKGIEGFICGEKGCHLERDGRHAAFSFSPDTHMEDCAWADILIADDPLEIKPCHAALVIDRFDLWRNGAYTIWLDGRYETVQSVRGTRPWTVSPRR